MAALVAYVLALASGHAAPATAQIAQENSALIAAVRADGETKKTEALETGALRASIGRAHRDKTGLHLRLSTGRDLLLSNHNDCPPPKEKFEQACVGYSLIADVKSRGAYVVAVSYYEGGDYLVIDDHTGRTTKVGAPPQFGPDGQIFLTIDNNEAYGDGSVQLWKRQGDGFRPVWTDQHGYNRALVQDWSQPSAIRLRLEPISGEPPLPRPAATIVKDRVWHFVGPHP